MGQHKGHCLTGDDATNRCHGKADRNLSRPPFATLSIVHMGINDFSSERRMAAYLVSEPGARLRGYFRIYPKEEEEHCTEHGLKDDGVSKSERNLGACPTSKTTSIREG